MIMTSKCLYTYFVDFFWVEHWGKFHKVKYLEKWRRFPGSGFGLCCLSQAELD